MSKLAVIQFPGSNCEYETARAAAHAGFDVDIIRWNGDKSQFKIYDAYILPGGFSYQDRVRAGVISAKLPIIDDLIDAANSGKPVLGICNGCQILAEAGLVPDTKGQVQVEMALGHNTKDDGTPHGFICDWVYVTVENASKSVFTHCFKDGDVLPIPVNHGEGRFHLASDVDISHLAQFRYCTPTGDVTGLYPVTPNGAEHNLAALANKAGNVLAIMPHPERAAFLKQVPYSIQSEWAQKKSVHMRDKTADDKGPWFPFFNAIRESVVAAVC